MVRVVRLWMGGQAAEATPLDLNGGVASRVGVAPRSRSLLREADGLDSAAQHLSRAVVARVAYVCVVGRREWECEGCRSQSRRDQSEGDRSGVSPRCRAEVTADEAPKQCRGRVMQDNRAVAGVECCNRPCCSSRWSRCALRCQCVVMCRSAAAIGEADGKADEKRQR